MIGKPVLVACYLIPISPVHSLPYQKNPLTTTALLRPHISVLLLSLVYWMTAVTRCILPTCAYSRGTVNHQGTTKQKSKKSNEAMELGTACGHSKLTSGSHASSDIKSCRLCRLRARYTPPRTRRSTRRTTYIVCALLHRSSAKIEGLEVPYSESEKEDENTECARRHCYPKWLAGSSPPNQVVRVHQ